MKTAKSLWLRGVLAIVLMVAFYLLALSIAGVLLYIPYAEWTYAGRLHIKLALFCVISGLIILWAIMPRIDRFDAPGPQLTADKHPRLFDELARIAQATKQELPTEVYAVGDVNAWVTQRGGIMGFGSRRVMGIGLPLMQSLTVSEMRGVLVHEFGHYVGGDTKVGPWVYKTRSAIIRAVQGLGDSVISKPFEWYGKAFLRITHAISRQQEFLADALAARVAGADAMKSGLRKIHGAALSYGAYWQNEVLPMLGQGWRPPIAAGFRHFASVTGIVNAVATQVQKEEKEGSSDPYDTHPSLRERVAAIEALGTSPVQVEDEPALTLLKDVPALETELLVHLGGKESAEKLKPMDWDRAGNDVWLPLWQDSLKPHIEGLKGLSVGDLPNLAKQPLTTLTTLRERQAEQGAADNEQDARRVLAAAAAVALANAGWSIRALPGEEVTLEKDGHRLSPFIAVKQSAEDKSAAEEWQRVCVESGVSALRMVVPT
jgi:heat shock protein HtpX